MNVTPLRNSVGRIGNWSQLPFFNDGKFDVVCARLAAESRLVLPAPRRILRAFELTPRSKVRVVIVGQAPYSNPQHVTGLAFAAPNNIAAPDALSHILDKVPPDRQRNQDLLHWAAQGVLLLNTTLTIPADLPSGQYNEHDRIGWSFLIRQTIESLMCRKDVFFIFFGVKTRDMDIIPSNLSSNRMILVGHPTNRGTPPKSCIWSRFESFIDSDPFNEANNFLRRFSSLKPIIW